jgi:hypothetical protein
VVVCAENLIIFKRISMPVNIFIDYKTSNSSQWETITLTPEEYFDKGYFEQYPEDEFEWNSLPEFDDAIDYIDVDSELITHTRIRVIDDKTKASRTLSTALWNNTENSITERVDKCSDSIDELTVIEIKLQDNPPEYEILRIQKENGVPMLEFHSIITDLEDGSQEERIIYPVRI